MLVWVHGRIEIVGMIEYAEMKSLQKMKKYGSISMPMWKRMNEKIMEKVLDFLEDKKHTVVRM